jgi:hypothetical protein
VHWIRPSRWSLACVVVVLVLIVVVAVASALTTEGPFTTSRPPSARPPSDRPPSDRPPSFGRRSAPDALRRAVAATLAARSSDVVARLSGPSTGVVVEVHGVTSFVEPLARYTTASGLATTRLPPAPSGLPAMPTEVRVRGQTAWIRAGPDGPWTAIAPGSALGPVGHPSWVDLFRSLVATPTHARWHSPTRRQAGTGTIATIVDGQPATVDLDQRGRIRALRLEKGAGVVFELELSNLGTEVVVMPP